MARPNAEAALTINTNENGMAIEQETNTGLRELALFAGAGGGILGGHLLGWRTVCAVEWDAYAASVLVARQNDGCLPPFPVWDDVQTFDGRPWQGRVDVVSGGFPCQDISAAGKGAGITGERSGMWKHMVRIVSEVRPRYIFAENSPLLVGRGLGMVLCDLAALGYDARWGIVGADDAGAPHRRKRIWILGHAQGVRLQGCCIQTDKPNIGETSTAGTGLLANAGHLLRGDGAEPAQAQSAEAARCGQVADASSERQPRQGAHWYACDPAEAREGETDRAWAERVGHVWGIESRLGRVANGVAHRMDRLRCIGNGQVPAVVRLAWGTLTT